MVKRGTDIVLGAVLAVVALPLIVVLAAGSAITLGAWPIFAQRRVGKAGREFPFVKLRTLPRSAPRAADKYEIAQNVRVPAFCRFLRRTHLDELPQLLLVPLGWMSLVGPRPEMPSVLADYPKELAATRQRVRPGCTGLWQVGPSSAKLIYEDPAYDDAYLRYGGFLLDAWIMLRTVRSFLPRPRPVELVDIPRWALGRGFPEREPTPADMRLLEGIASPVADRE